MSDSDSSHTCDICCENPRNVRLDCGHSVYCTRCVLSSNKCPVCRSSYDIYHIVVPSRRYSRDIEPISTHSMPSMNSNASINNASIDIVNTIPEREFYSLYNVTWLAYKISHVIIALLYLLVAMLNNWMLFCVLGFTLLASVLLHAISVKHNSLLAEKMHLLCNCAVFCLTYQIIYYVNDKKYDRAASIILTTDIIISVVCYTITCGYYTGYYMSYVIDTPES